MKKIYILTNLQIAFDDLDKVFKKHKVKDTDALRSDMVDIISHLQKKAYFSKFALYADNTPEELGVSTFTIDRVDFTFDSYENDKIKIELLNAKSKSDILEEKGQFL